MERPQCDDRRQVAAPEAVPGIVTNSKAMGALVDRASRVAALDSTVLLVGERGVGKARVARFMHRHSARAGAVFIAVRCGALGHTVLEIELFGHVRGAFAGATQDRGGLLERANGGTLVLQDVDDAPLAVQVKLLRALQERQVRRVGEGRGREIDVRVVVVTNRDLGEAVRAGTFRRDLYERLEGTQLHVPPLRERAEDIVPLAHMYLADAAARMKRTFNASFGAEVAEMLQRYAWPRNVRELGNAMERAAAVARHHEVVAADLPDELRPHAPNSAMPAEPARPLELG